MAFLDSKDDEVLTVSLQALHFLSSYPGNREVLSKQPGLLVKLVNFTEKEDKLVKQIASQCLENLQSYVNGLQEKREQKETVFSPRYLYNINLAIVGLTVAYRSRVEKALIGVKGVVSVTFEESLEHTTVYCTQKESEISSALVVAIEGLDLSLSVTVTDKENVKSSTASSDKNTFASPEKSAAYPASSMSTPVSKPHSSSISYASGGAPTYFDKTNVRRGSVTLYNQQATLRERQAEQRRREQEQAAKQTTVRTLFGKVSSFFW